MLKRIVATALAMAFVLSLTTGLAVAAAKPAGQRAASVIRFSAHEQGV